MTNAQADAGCRCCSSWPCAHAAVTTTTRPTTRPRPRCRTAPASSTTEPVDATDPTDPPATTAPTTTTNTSTTTSTTVPPPTVEEQIAADYQLIYDGYWACLRAPLNCDMSWLVPGSGSEQAMTDHDAGARRSGPLCRRGGSRLLRDRVDHRRRRRHDSRGRVVLAVDRRAVRPTGRRLTARSAPTTQPPSSTTHQGARGRPTSSCSSDRSLGRSRTPTYYDEVAEANQCAPES